MLAHQRHGAVVVLIMDNTEGDNEVVFPDSESLSLTFQVRDNGRGLWGG